MLFPLLLVCRCFNVLVCVAVEAAGPGPRVSGDVSFVSRSCLWSQQGNQEKEGCCTPGLGRSSISPEH